MIVVGNNLKELALSYEMCAEADISEHSINVSLGRTVRIPKEHSGVVKYGKHSVEKLYETIILEKGELILEKGQRALACSNTEIRMPPGYLGLLQTKGTLARFFVSIHSSSSQIEPGFNGVLTLEMFNNAPFDISIDVGAPVAKIYIIRCSTDNSRLYNGKYLGKNEPSIPLPFA